MKINVNINDSDYIKFNEYYMLNSQQGKKMIAMMKLLMPVFAIALVAIFAICGMEKSLLLAEIAVLTIASVIWIGKAPKYFLKQMGKNINKMKKEGKLPYSENAVLEFGDAEIIETTENSVKKVKYSEISRIGDTDEHIFVFFGAMEAFVIPKRCITDAQVELEKMLDEKVHN